MFALLSNKFMSALNSFTSAVAHAIMSSDLDSRNRAFLYARYLDQFLAQVHLCSMMHPLLPTSSAYKTQCHPEVDSNPIPASLCQQGKVFSSHSLCHFRVGIFPSDHIIAAKQHCGFTGHHPGMHLSYWLTFLLSES